MYSERKSTISADIYCFIIIQCQEYIGTYGGGVGITA